MLKTTVRRASVLALVAVAVGAPSATLAQKPKAHKAQPDVTVMSRNLYLGADIITLASAGSPEAEKTQVAALYSTVQQTDFPKRAQALAGEVAKQKPDVIGLQEVARYYRSPGATGQATKKVLDWLTLLQKQIRKRGLRYRVVAQQTELDVTAASAAGYNLRLTLGNAVLVRQGKQATVSVVKGLHGLFPAKGQLGVPLADGQTVKLERGYAGADLKVAGRRFRFLDPHAEAYSAAFAKAQLKNLLATAAKSRKYPVIIAGDLNSDPADKEPNAYKAVIAGGFADTAKRTATCCQDPDLGNARSHLKTWIDHIVVRPKAKVLRRAVVGNKPSARIGGLWPSDHAGVVVRLRLK